MCNRDVDLTAGRQEKDTKADASKTSVRKRDLTLPKASTGLFLRGDTEVSTKAACSGL